MTSPSSSPRKSGNVLKWVAIGCGGATLLFIGLVVGAFFWFKQAINLSFDATQAEDVARNIMDYEIPGGSQGIISTSVAGFEFAGVTSASNPDSVILFLGKVPPDAQGSEAQLQESLEQSMEQQMNESFTVKNQRTESRQLCGQTVNVEILEGEQTSGNQTVPAFSYQTFVNHNNNTLLVLLTTAGTDAQANAEQVFGSLQCK